MTYSTRGHGTQAIKIERTFARQRVNNSLRVRLMTLNGIVIRPRDKILPTLLLFFFFFLFHSQTSY